MPCCSEISFIVLVPGRNDAGRRAHGGGEAHPVPEDAGEEEEAEAFKKFPQISVLPISAVVTFSSSNSRFRETFLIKIYARRHIRMTTF